jgi:hypothetical protein
MTDARTDDREGSIAKLFRELSQETAGLVREELGLVREELGGQAQRLAPGAAFLGAAGVLGVGAFGALTAGLVAALGRGHVARGALLVASLYGAGAGALAVAARNRLSETAPQAVQAVQRDAKAAAEGIREGVSSSG